jgi:hypothetical protein
VVVSDPKVFERRGLREDGRRLLAVAYLEVHTIGFLTAELKSIQT